MMRSLTVFIAAMLLVSSDGFSYSRVLPSTSNPRAAQRTVVAVDTNVIIGCAVGLAGIAGGVGVMSFAEKQAIRTSESGALSDEVSFYLLILVSNAPFQATIPSASDKD